MKHLFLAAIIWIISLPARAQEPLEKMETDRPDQTESPSIVPKGWLQFEAGLVREQETYGALYTAPTVLSKYGLLKKLELRLITEYTSLYREHFTDSFGIGPIAVGFKYNLLQEKGLLPQTSFIAHTHFNRLASRHYKGHTFFAPAFRFTMQHTLTNQLGLGYNLGAEWEDTDVPPAYIYTLAPGFAWGENWYAYVELFGSVQKHEKPEHNFDGGIAYHLTDNMRADLSAGVGISSNSFDHYVAVGFSFRFATSKKFSHPAP